ncbi:hypothetical protein, partial [Aeromonas media]|uniref:hypothetical protein n=1 Tax=Aeromonas media TaxID=651 RepID=UPI003D06ED37
CGHDADLKRMVVIRSPSPQLVPFKPYRFGKQRHANPTRQSLQALTCNSDTFTGKSPEYADKTAGILRSRKTNVLSL